MGEGKGYDRNIVYKILKNKELRKESQIVTCSQSHVNIKVEYIDLCV